MKLNSLYEALDLLIPNPVCELNYNKDYELLMAVMLSAQTTDKRVNSITKILFSKYPTLKDIYEADINDLIEVIRPIGTFQIKAKNLKGIAKRLLEDANGAVPNDRVFLESLPGVGRKTTNVVLSILFNEPCIAVDTHVSRVSVRLGLAKKGDDVLTIERKLTRKLDKRYLNKLHHQLLLFGRYYCMARNPKCLDCPLKEMCKENK